MSELSQRQAPLGHQRNLAAGAWRQRGFEVARYGRAPLLSEKLLELAGEAGARAYREGIRTGDRERRRSEVVGTPSQEGEG